MESKNNTLKKENTQSKLDWEKKIKVRQEYNFKCLDKVKEIIEKYPDLRFCQILFNMKLAKDRFYEESVDTFEKIKNF